MNPQYSVTEQLFFSYQGAVGEVVWDCSYCNTPLACSVVTCSVIGCSLPGQLRHGDCDEHVSRKATVHPVS